MPVLDAEALKSDPKGLAFLKAVLGQRSAAKPRWRPPTSRLPSARAESDRPELVR